MEAPRQLVSTIARIIVYRGDMTFSDDKNIVLVNSLYRPGTDSFRVRDRHITNPQSDLALVLGESPDVYFLSMLMNSIFFRSSVKEGRVLDRPKKITIKSIRDYSIPIVDFSLQRKLSQIERLIELFTSDTNYSSLVTLIHYLYDLRDCVCMELYMSSFFNRLGVSIIDELSKVTDEVMDFSQPESIRSFAIILAGPDSLVRPKVQEMNIILSHFFKNLDDLLKKNDLENK